MRKPAIALLLSLAATPTLAQETVGTIIVAHGGGEEWNALVKGVAAQSRTGGPVEVSFLMGPAAKADPFQNVARRLEQAGVSRIVVVPLLVSSHSGHYEQIRYLAGQTDKLDETMMHHLHMGGLQRAQVRVPITVTRAIDDSPEAARVLAERIHAADPQASGRAAFLVGHGPNAPEEQAAWMKNLRILADSVRRSTGFSDVRVGIVQDDAPPPVRAEAVTRVREVIELQHAATKQSVLVIPVLISSGSLSRQKLPEDLKGLPITYRPEALLPSPTMARWIERRVKEAGDPTAVSGRN